MSPQSSSCHPATSAAMHPKMQLSTRGDAQLSPDVLINHHFASADREENSNMDLYPCLCFNCETKSETLASEDEGLFFFFACPNDIKLEASPNVHFPHQEITVQCCIPPFDLWTMTQRSSSSGPVLVVSGQKSLDKSASPLPKWRWVNNLFQFNANPKMQPSNRNTVSVVF